MGFDMCYIIQRLARVLEHTNMSIAEALEKIDEYPEEYDLRQLEKRLEKQGYYTCHECKRWKKYVDLHDQSDGTSYCEECY